SPCKRISIVDTRSHDTRTVFQILARALRPTLFPYTTLFRSWTASCSTMAGTISPVNGCLARHLNTASAPLKKRQTACIPQSACRSEEHTSELQSRFDLVCRLLLEKKK